MIKIDKQDLKPNLKTKENSNIIDLELIGDAIAVKVTELTGKTVNSKTISLLYLSYSQDAIGYCQLQYDYYLQKGVPENTPVYLYVNTDHTVLKMGDTLGTVDMAVDALNKKGAGFVAAHKILK